MASYARDIISHKCYRKADRGNKELLKKLLREDKAKNPVRIPYFLSASKELPDKFLLSYQPGSRPRYEYVSLTPDGFRYRSKVLTKLQQLLNWFKAHFHEPIPRPQPVNPAPAAPSGSHIQNRITPADSYRTDVSSHGPSSTPYTPTHLPYTTPQYGGQPSSFAHPAGGGYPTQQPQYHHGGSAGYPQQQQQQRDWSHSGGGWDSSQMAAARTPMSSGSGRTPAYTPTQTPQSAVSNMYGATPSSMDDRHRREPSPMGTPLLDEN